MLNGEVHIHRVTIVLRVTTRHGQTDKTQSSHIRVICRDLEEKVVGLEAMEGLVHLFLRARCLQVDGGLSLLLVAHLVPLLRLGGTLWVGVAKVVGGVVDVHRLGTTHPQPQQDPPH